MYLGWIGVGGQREYGVGYAMRLHCFADLSNGLLKASRRIGIERPIDMKYMQHRDLIELNPHSRLTRF